MNKEKIFLLISLIILIISIFYFFKSYKNKNLIINKDFIYYNSKNIKEYKYPIYYKNYIIKIGSIADTKIYKEILREKGKFYDDDIFENTCYFAKIFNNKLFWYIGHNITKASNNKVYNLYLVKSISKENIVKANLSFIDFSKIPKDFLAKNTKTIYDILDNNEFDLTYLFKVNQIKIYFIKLNADNIVPNNRNIIFSKFNIIYQNNINSAALYFNKKGGISEINIRLENEIELRDKYNFNAMIALKDFAILIISAKNIKLDDKIIKIFIPNKAIYPFVGNLILFPSYTLNHICTNII